MKMPYPIQPARAEFKDGYEIDFSSRDIIPIRFVHALAAAVILPLTGALAYAATRLIGTLVDLAS